MKQERRVSSGMTFGLLGVMFLALISIRITEYGPMYGISIFAILTISLILSQVAVSKKQLAMLFVVLELGFLLRYWGVIGIAAVDVVLITIVVVLISLVLVATRIITSKYDKLPGTLVFPILWTVLLFIMMVLRVPSVVRIDIMFFDIKPIMQIESIITSYGLSFMILWAVSLVVFAILNHSLKALAVLAGIVIVVLGYGFASLADADSAKSDETTIKVAYTTGPYCGTLLDYKDNTYNEDAASFEKTFAEAAETGADVLVYNEESFEITESQVTSFVWYAQKQAIKNDMHLLIGLDIGLQDGSDMHNNRIFWIDNKGRIIGEYDKYKLIPILESNYLKGEGKLPSYAVDIKGETINVAFAICYDSNYPSYINNLADDTDILFLPSWDWAGITKMHYRLCGSLAVENRVAVIKPTYDGYSITADKYGRVLKLTSTDETGYESVQVVDIPIERRGKR